LPLQERAAALRDKDIAVVRQIGAVSSARIDLPRVKAASAAGVAAAAAGGDKAAGGLDVDGGSYLPPSHAPAANITIEGPIGCVKVAFGLLIEHLLTSAAGKAVTETFTIPGELIGPVVGEEEEEEEEEEQAG